MGFLEGVSAKMEKLLKIIKKFKPLKKKSILIGAIVLAICLVPAYADDWEGWTADKQEEAWTVYVATEWDTVPDLNFSVSGGSIASADVPDDFREEYGPVVDSVLADSSLTTVYYDSTNRRNKSPYKELLLAMGYTLNKKGEFDNMLDTEDRDVCFVNKYVNASASIYDAEDSFEALFRRLINAERSYCNNHLQEAQAYSIYSNDDYLAAVVQGTLYGAKYLKENASYSSDNANAFYSANKSSVLVKWNGFADEVLSIYSAVRSVNDHTVVG